LLKAQKKSPRSFRCEGFLATSSYVETIMKRMLMLAWICVPLLSQAGPADPQETERQRQCSMEASGKTIDARSGSIQECTGGKSTQEPLSGSQEAQHSKRKACSAEAMQKSESERARHIEQCMRKQ
jgi:hypothetical protein